jgi:hypothetical protein
MSFERRGGLSQSAAAAGAAVATILALVLASARADVVHLEGGGKIRGTIIEETPTRVIVRTAAGSTHVVRRDEIARIERELGADQEFEQRWKAIAEGDANGFYELGKWAVQKQLKEQAERAFKKAISIDPEHGGAREALGHRKHNGRWYDEAGYKKAVEGLVEWNGQWVTPAERDLLEQGFIKNEKGEWVRKEDLARQELERKAAAERNRTAAAGGEKPDAKEGAAGGKPPVATAAPSGTPSSGAKKVEIEPEDTSWYDDHTTCMSWKDAGLKPYESNDYLVYTNIKPEYAKRYCRMLDVYATKFRRVFNTEENVRGGGRVSMKGKIYIYPDQLSFMQGEGVGEGVGGFYQPGANRVVCYHGRFGQTGTTRTVLVHEATHQYEDLVLNKKMYNAPIWIIEGLAVFFESAFWDGKTVNIGYVPRERLEVLKQGISTGQYIPLPELIRTPHSAFSGFHYAHAWSLIYYMLYGGKTEKIRKHNQKIFSDLFFLAKVRGQPVTPEDVEALWGGKEKFQAWEEEWKQWVLDLPFDFDPKDPDASRARAAEKPQEPAAEGPPSTGDGPGKTEPRNILEDWDEALQDLRRRQEIGAPN